MQGILKRPQHILTFDLEEHFHASRFDSPMRRRHWSSFESRIHTNVERILELLSLHSTKATFFALGWLAEQHPSIIRMVSAAGHEIACLGYGHELVAAQTHRVFDRTFVEPSISWRVSRDTRSSDSVHQA